jgi:hypothetical protein
MVDDMWRLLLLATLWKILGAATVTKKNLWRQNGRIDRRILSPRSADR